MQNNAPLNIYILKKYRSGSGGGCCGSNSNKNNEKKEGKCFI